MAHGALEHRIPGASPGFGSGHALRHASLGWMNVRSPVGINHQVQILSTALEYQVLTPRDCSMRSTQGQRATPESKEKASLLARRPKAKQRLKSRHSRGQVPIWTVLDITFAFFGGSFLLAGGNIGSSGGQAAPVLSTPIKSGRVFSVVFILDTEKLRNQFPFSAQGATADAAPVTFDTMR